tara:strand:- start:480 stop:2393 length:1914 start_codon:yes stop_codon:yes gene_type:complete
MKSKVYLSFFIFTVTACLSVSTETQSQEPTWKINTAKNIDIHQFINQISSITGKTFVVDPKLRGQVTVISDAPLDKDGVYELFLSVLRLQNYTAVPSGNLVKIQQSATGKQAPGLSGDLESLAPEGLVTRVIRAQNVEATELVKILRPLIPQYGHIGAVVKSNILIISDHADNVARLKKLVKEIDIADEEEVVMLPLKEAWVGNVVALLEKLAPEQIGKGATGPQKVQIIANERNNSLVMKGNKRPLTEVIRLVEKLDKPATTADSTQVIILKYADATEAANILNALITGRRKTEESEQQSEETIIQADPSLNAVVVRTDPGTMGEILDIVEKLDIRRPQVLIEAAIVEVSIDESKKIGIEMAGADAREGSVPLISTSLEGVIGSLIGGLLPEGESDQVNVLSGLASVSSPTLAAAKIDRDAISFGAVVSALATNSDANLLSTPSILTLDNQEARILVGREVPFRTGSFTTTGDGTSNPFNTVQREDVGVELTVTPHVHNGSEVRLEVAQQITNVINTPVGGNAFADVVTSKRTIETTILAEDRQTIVLGGLIQDDINISNNRVPFVGDIPLFGNLFKARGKQQVKTNLLVFLRPTVLRTQDDAEDLSASKYNSIWEVEIESTNHQSFDDLFKGIRP